jgi:hypothetical protein
MMSITWILLGISIIIGVFTILYALELLIHNLPPASLPIIDFRASFTWVRFASLIAGGTCIIIGLVRPKNNSIH